MTLFRAGTNKSKGICPTGQWKTRFRIKAHGLS